MKKIFKIQIVESMDLLNQVLGLFKVLRSNLKLSKAQIVLYVVILDKWNMNYRKPIFFPIVQAEMMKFSRIGNAGTYSNCLKTLAKKKLIYYKPGSRVNKALVKVIPAQIIKSSFKKTLYKEISKSAITQNAKLGSIDTRTAINMIPEMESPLKRKDFKRIKGMSNKNFDNKANQEKNIDAAPVRQQSTFSNTNTTRNEKKFKQKYASKTGVNYGGAL